MAIVDPFAAKPKNPGIVDPFTAPAIPRAISDLSGAPAVEAPAAAGYNLTDIPKELVAGALHGTGSAISGIGDVGRMIARPIVAGVNAANGSDVLPEPTNAFEPIGSAISKVGERVAGSESVAAQEAKAKPIITGDITRPETLSLGEGAKSPMALALGAANLAGEVVPMLAGGLEGRALKLAPEIVEALPGIAAKLSRGEALTAGETAAAEAGAAATKSAGRRALGTGAAIGGVQGAEGSSEGERARIEAMSESDISKLPGYQSKLQSGMNPADARAAVADEAANSTFMATLPVATIAGAVGTAPLLHETQSVLSKIAGEGVARRAAVGAALEAPVQGAAAVAQNAASIAGANEATGETRDVTENSAPIALTGAALGAGFGAFGGVVTRPKAAVPYPDAPAGSLSDAANAVHEHGAKPITPEAAAETGEGTLTQAARTEEAPVVPAATAQTAPPGTEIPAPATRSQQPAPTEVAPADLAASQTNQSPSVEATAEAPAPQPPSVPWVNAETGEFSKPTDSQLRDQFHKMFAAADEGGSTMRATAASRMLADEWGVPRERLIEQRRYALDERNNGFKAGDARPEQTEIGAQVDTPVGVARDETSGVHAATATREAADVNQDHAVQERVQHLVPHEEPVPSPEGQVLSTLRRDGSSDLPGVAEKLQRVHEGHGAEADTQALDRQDRSERQLRATELPVGDAAAASGKSTVLPLRDVEGAKDDGAGTGKDGGPGAVDGTETISDGAAVARDGQEGLGAAEKRQVSDDQRGNPNSAGVGEAGGNIAPSVGGEAAAGDSAGTTSSASSSDQGAGAVEMASRESAAHPENGLTEPTPAQQQAGNFQSGHVNLHGLDVTIQVPKGGMRRGTTAKGKPWERAASDHYGHIKRTIGADSEQVDVYLGPHAEAPDSKVFVIDQVKPGTRIFDESKSMIGYATGREARRSYDANFPKGLKTFGGIREMSVEQFKQWVKSDAAKKPVSDLPLLPAVKGKRESKVMLAERARRLVEGEKASEQPAAPAVKAEPTAITDIGEKIGGARKDLSGGKSERTPRAKPTDERPTWAKRFDIGEIAASHKPGEVGRWTIRDSQKKDRMGQARQVGSPFSSKAEAEAAIPLYALALKHRVVERDKGNFGVVRDVTDRKRVYLKDGFKTREEAMQYMVDNAATLIEQKTSVGEEALPKPETVSRAGPAHREGDATPEHFANEFGFRGVEFGNWNNQAERQEVMNHAYDGLRDLAELLNIPPKAISLNGELGLAFGARGHGLSSARAHYEPDYAVMNLTKMQGAGALAHEWMHALDHYLGRQDTKASSVRVKNERGDTVIKAKGAESDFLSYGASHKSQLREELKVAYADLMKTMQTKGTKYVEDTAAAEKFVGKARDNLADEIQKLRDHIGKPREWGNKKAAGAPEQLARFDAAVDSILSGEALATTWQLDPKSKSRNGGMRWSNAQLEGMNDIVKAITGRAGFNKEGGSLDKIRQMMTYYAQRLEMLRRANEGVEQEKRTPTDYAMEAKKADQGRGTNYWSTPHELAARAFSSYVEDRLASQKRSSEFLSYGSEHRFVLPIPEFPRPFPGGAERAAINAAFDKFFGEVKTRETDQGTALFRRGNDTDEVMDPARAHAQSVSDAVRDVVKDWGESAPRVRVVATGADLPLRAQLADPRYASAKGFYDGNGNAYIVAANHASVQDALATVAHEAIGHHGIENILNDHVKGGWDKLSADIDRLRTEGLGSKAMQDVLADVEKRYPGADKTTFAQETLAVMAERGIRNGLIDRAIAAVRAYLRKIMPNMRMSEADLRALLQHSEDYITAGTPLEQRQAQLAAMSFSHAAEAGLTPAEAARPTTAADAARAYREQGTDSPYFKKFFGASKVVDQHGDPLTVYHGTGEDFSVFEPSKAGTATEHSTSPLGHFFTENKKLAERYAENAADGRPADQRVIDAYVKIEKPYEMSLDEAHGIDDPAQARALRAKLEREGYDGIHIAEAKSWVPFKSEQIKSVENRGTFDAKHGDINFSLPEASMDALDEVIARPDEGTFAKAKDWARGKAEDFRPAALGALQTRHVIELADQHQALKAAKQYGEKMQALDSDRYKLISGSHDAAEHPNDMLKKGGATIAGDTQKFAREKGVGGWLGRENPETRSLAEVMNQATIHGLDPSMEYTRLMMEDKNGRFMPWTPQAVNEKIRSIRGQMRGRPGDDKRAMMDEVKMLRGLKGREANRVRTWPQLLAAWQKLSPEAKKVYQEHRDWYAQMRDETEKGIIARVEAIGRDMAGTAGAERAQRFMNQTIQRIRLQFELNRLEGVYFPLNRDGDFWMSISDAKGQQGFKMFESAAEAASAEKKLRAAGFKIDAQGRRDSAGSAKQSVPGTFIGDIIGLLKKNGAPEKVQDEVYQTFLRTLPEMSMRKHSIHRKKVPGFEDDPVRAFSKNSFHGAHQLARLRHSHEMQGLVDAMQLSMDNYRQGTGGGENKALDVARGDALLGEIKKRHEYIMSPKDTQLANVANSIGFIYNMALTPAAALTNLTQNAQVTLPVLGAHHGWAGASRQLGAAVRDSLRTGGNIDRTLTNPTERMAYNVLRERGDITKTQTHTLAGLAEGNKLTTNPVWARAMTGMSYLFHKAEVVNREAAGIAAFRLQYAKTKNFQDSVQYASDIVNGTHFDYSAANRPRYMQGNTARVALQFKNYSVGMTWMLYRNLYQAFNGESPEVRSVARKTLTGILGMTGLMAGTMGLPIINAMRFAGNAAHSLFGSDEEPNWDFDTEFRSWLADNLGEDAAKYVADGAVNRLGANLATRTSLSNLWFRDADKELEGKDAYYAMLESVVGPLGGLAKNIFVGSKMAGDGQVYRGIETMMPKFAKDAMKATRFAHDGANTLRGDPILPDMTGPEAFIQGIGFQPTRLFETQRTNSALKNYEQGILDRRQTLMNAYAMAVSSGDDRDVAMAKIHAFNQQYPEIALKADSIRQSLRARARYTATADSGIFINKKIRERVHEEVGQPSL